MAFKSPNKRLYVFESLFRWCKFDSDTFFFFSSPFVGSIPRKSFKIVSSLESVKHKWKRKFNNIRPPTGHIFSYISYHRNMIIYLNNFERKSLIISYIFGILSYICHIFLKIQKNVLKIHFCHGQKVMDKSYGQKFRHSENNNPIFSIFSLFFF